MQVARNSASGPIAHQRGGERADHRAGAVEEQEPARDRDEVAGIGVVVGMRHGEPVDRIGERAVDAVSVMTKAASSAASRMKMASAGERRRATAPAIT